MHFRFSSAMLRRTALSLLVPFFFQACGSSGPTGEGNDGAIAVSLSSTSASIAQGGSAASTATLTRSGGFTGAVTITTTGAPTGVVAGVSNTVTTGTTTTALITVVVAADAPAGTYNLTIKAQGSGVADATATFALTITANSSPNYSLSLTPAAGSSVQGGTVNTAVTLTRVNGFVGSVNLSLTNAPAGVTAVFTPNNTTTAASTAVISVGARVVPGQYTVYVGGVAAGQGDKVTPFVLTVTAAGSYTLSVPTTGSVVQGSAITPTVTVARVGGFNGSIALTATGMPTGMTVGFAPSAVASPATSSVMTITTTAGVTAGSYPIVVHANSAGTAEQLSTITVTVTSATSFTLSAATTASVTQGSSVAPAITINRVGGFNGAVTLLATGMPTGMTALFSPNGTTTNGSTMTISTTGATAVGSYPVVVHGNATGAAEALTTITVTVTAAGGGGNVSVSVVDCAVIDRPIWFSFQNGGGAWTVVTPTNNVYSFTVNASTGGFAYVKQSVEGNTQVTVQQYTLAELTSVPLSICGAPANGKTITGTTAGIGALDGVLLSLGGSVPNPAPTLASPGFTLLNVPNGTFDLVGFRRALLAPGAGDRAFIRRDQNIANNGSAGTVDFNGVDSYAVQTANLTVPNGAGTIFHSMIYLTGAGCTAGGLYSATTSPLLMEGFPSAQQRANDYYLIGVTESNGSSSRGVQESFHTFGAKSISLGSLLSVPTVTSLGGPYKRLQSVFTIPADYHASASFLYSTATSPARSVLVAASYGVFGGSTGTLALPDFSALSGWNNIWAPASAQSAASPTTTVAGTTVTSTLCQEGVRIPFASYTTGAM